jgi:hypothetical protein
MISGTIHRLSGTDELGDFRTSMKILAGILRSDKRIPRDRRYFMRRVTEQVADGNPRLKDVIRWHDQAVRMVRGLA